MSELDKEEKKNKKIGLTVSVGLHCLVLLLFLLLTAWIEPFPANPGIPGIEVALGFDAVGSGDIKSDNPANDSESEEDAKPDEKASSESVSQPEQTVESTEDIATTKADSPHKVTETSKTSTPKEDTKVAETKPKTETTPTKETTKDGADGKTGQNLMSSGSNFGDKDKKGDMGDPQGKPDSKNLLGTPGGGGGGGGPELKLDGWRWDDAPDKSDKSNESGRIVFAIVVNDQGYIKSVRVVESTVSPSVVDFYKKQVEQLTFSRLTSAPAPSSTSGNITFIVKSK
jgi:periplasmic protein TonB